MENKMNNGQFVALTKEEMSNLNAGAKATTVAKVVGYIIGVIARSQEQLGDSGQWLA
jgi:hypothetical protein